VADDELPSADDFGLLHQIDGFNAKIKQAMASLRPYYPERFILLLLQAHAHGLMPESPLVNRLALDADERTGGRRRREIAEQMFAAGALSDANLERLRKRLSEARRERGDLVDVDEPVDDDPLPDDDGVFDSETEARLEGVQKVEAADDAVASIAMVTLQRLGVFSWSALRIIVAADTCSHGITVEAIASELKTDASALKTDG
jgi:hypothetical protein